MQLLLGHIKLEGTVRYLGVEVDDALELAEQKEFEWLKRSLVDGRCSERNWPRPWLWVAVPPKSYILYVYSAVGVANNVYWFRIR